MKELTHLSLFSGIGGLDLAAKWAGFRTIGQCEWADYPTKVLEKHWPDVPRWRDIRTLTGDDFYARTGLRTVDIISGGFPCQPFSVAGKRRGKEDDRYLWPEMCRVISEIRPSWVIGENVLGIVNLALDTVLSDLESQDYACQTFIIPACGVDAPHRRNRIAIVAYSGGIRCGNRPEQKKNQEPKIGEKGFLQQKRKAWNNSRVGRLGKCGNVPDADGAGCQEFNASGKPTGAGQYSRVHNPDNVPDAHNRRGPLRRSAGRDYRERAAEYEPGEWWPAEPDVGRVANGVPSRVDRLKCLGNAVVPAQFYPFFRWIAEIEQA